MKKNATPARMVFLLVSLLICVNANYAALTELAMGEGGRFSQSGRNLLIVLGAILAVLIVIFLVLLLKSTKNSPGQTGEGVAPGGDNAATSVIPMPGAAAQVTQFLQNPLAELRVEQGSDQGAVFTVSKNASAIGRSGARSNDVILTDKTVSKVQATLYFDPASGCFSLINESPKNQTKVNGVIAYQHIPLSGGELIEMGRTALRFKIL